MSANKTTYRFHLLSDPEEIIQANSADLYLSRVFRFCEMLTMGGHTLFFYGHPQSNVKCQEKVTLSGSLEKELLARLEPRDFVVAFGGQTERHHGALQAVRDTGKGIIFEPSICQLYPNSLVENHVFESSNLLHFHNGQQHLTTPSWYQVVIPLFFNPEDYTFTKDATKKQMVLVPKQGDLGTLGTGDFPFRTLEGKTLAERKQLYAQGKCLLAPTAELDFDSTLYLEAMLSGVPVITSDWGCAPELVLHGLTGYRCHNQEQFLWALENIDKIDREHCRSWAENFSYQKALSTYEDYFQQLYDLWSGGWYQGHPERTTLNSCNVYHFSNLSSTKHGVTSVKPPPQTTSSRMVAPRNFNSLTKPTKHVVNKKVLAFVLVADLGHPEAVLAMMENLKEVVQNFGIVNEYFLYNMGGKSSKEEAELILEDYPQFTIINLSNNSKLEYEIRKVKADYTMVFHEGWFVLEEFDLEKLLNEVGSYPEVGMVSFETEEPTTKSVQIKYRQTSFWSRPGPASGNSLPAACLLKLNQSSGLTVYYNIGLVRV